MSTIIDGRSLIRRQQKEVRINWPAIRHCTCTWQQPCAEKAKSEKYTGWKGRSRDSRQQSEQQHDLQTDRHWVASFALSCCEHYWATGNTERQMTNGQTARRLVTCSTREQKRVIEVTGMPTEDKKGTGRGRKKHKALLLNEWINAQQKAKVLVIDPLWLWASTNLELQRQHKHHQLAMSDMSKQHQCQDIAREFIAGRWVIADYCWCCKRKGLLNTDRLTVKNWLNFQCRIWEHTHKERLWAVRVLTVLCHLTLQSPSPLL